MVRPMVHSEKHIVQNSIATVAGGAIGTVIIADGVAVGDKNLVSEVEEGSIIKAIYMEQWIRAGSTTPSSGQAVLYKTQAAQSTVTTTEMAALNDWDNKRNVIYTTMGLYNDQDADATLVGKTWFKIPKGKQRMALGDKWKFSLFTPTIDLQFCGFFLYKEYK